MHEGAFLPAFVELGPPHSPLLASPSAIETALRGRAYLQPATGSRDCGLVGFGVCVLLETEILHASVKLVLPLSPGAIGVVTGLGVAS